MNRALAALAAILVAGVAIPFSTPFALIALVPLYYAARAGSWRTAVGGTAAVVTAVASQSQIWGESQPPAAYVATAGARRRACSRVGSRTPRSRPLTVSGATVKTHVSNLLVRDRVHAVILAYASGLVTVRDR